jgi:hypothetical protein
MTLPNIPNEGGRFNGTAEILYAADDEFNGRKPGRPTNSTQKLFIGGNSFPGTSIVSL